MYSRRCASSPSPASAVLPSFSPACARVGAEMVSAHPFPDHHRYAEGELFRLRREAEPRGARLVTTAKDWARLPPSAPRHRRAGGRDPLAGPGGGDGAAVREPCAGGVMDTTEARLAPDPAPAAVVLGRARRSRRRGAVLRGDAGTAARSRLGHGRRAGTAHRAVARRVAPRPGRTSPRRCPN